MSYEDAECIADGLHAIAKSIDRLSVQVDRLGQFGASGPMGAVEAVAYEIKNGSERLSGTLSEMTNSVTTEFREAVVEVIKHAERTNTLRINT
jgi:hypothetical protein